MWKSQYTARPCACVSVHQSYSTSIIEHDTRDDQNTRAAYVVLMRMHLCVCVYVCVCTMREHRITLPLKLVSLQHASHRFTRSLFYDGLCHYLLGIGSRVQVSRI